MFRAFLLSAAALLLAPATLPAALSAAQAPAPAPSAVTVSLWSFGFAPAPIRLAAGRPVTLTFVNRSRSGHDFTAPGFFARARILSGSAPGGRVALAGHQSRSITLVPAPGRYRAHCSHFLHAPMGMSADILVG